MKRIFCGILAALVLMILLVAPCFAADATATEVIVEGGTVIDAVPESGIAGEAPDETQVTDVLTDGWNWLMGHKDDIMAGILLIAATLYKLGTSAIKKKILPDITKQSETTTEIAAAAGKLTQANKANFEAAISELKKILDGDEERETRLCEAIAASERNKEEYRNMCEKYEVQNKALVAALLAQEQMVYESLMSAKLTDVRKEEIERQHLERMNAYKALMPSENGGDADEDVAA